MSLPLAPDALPLKMDEYGAVRVGGTRITLDDLVAAHRNQGWSAERIAEEFDTLDLADVYAALGYYLRHRAEVDEYLARRDAEAAEVRRMIEASQRPFPSKAELLARMAARNGNGS